MRRTLLLGVLILLPRVAAGQEERRPQPVQELFFTEVVYPQEKGEIQLTFGTLVDRSGGRTDKSALMPLSIEYGLTNRWQIQAGWDGHTQFHNSPFKNIRTARVSVGTKYSWMNIARSPVHAAFGMDVEFPRTDTFAEGEGKEGMELEPFVAFASDLPWSVSVFGSVGLSFEPKEIADLAEHAARPDDRGTISFGALKAFHAVTLAAEYTNRSDQLPWRLDGAPLLTPSIVLHPGHQWELSAGLPVALRHGQHQPGLAMNIIKEF